MAERVKQLSETWTLTATFPANLPANGVVVLNFTRDPLRGAVTQEQVPQTENWVIDDMWIEASQTPNTIIILKRNIEEDLLRSPPINTLLVSNPSRPMIPRKRLKRGDILTGTAINLAAIGTASETITLYIKVMRFIQRS